MAFRPGDLVGVFYRHFGVTVVLGAVTSKGLWDTESTQVLPGESTSVTVQEPSVRVRTGVFPALALKVALTVDGVAYTVRGIEQVPPDAAETRIRLQRA